MLEIVFVCWAEAAKRTMKGFEWDADDTHLTTLDHIWSHPFRGVHAPWSTRHLPLRSTTVEAVARPIYKAMSRPD